MNILRNKKENWSFVIYKDYEVDGVVDIINNFNSEWYTDLERKKIYQTHKDTDCITVIKMGYDLSSPDQNVSQKILDLPECKGKNQIDFIVEDLEKNINGKIIRFEIIKMKAFGRIRSHKDRGDISFLSRRIHIPIITNEKVIFKVMDESINMKQGIAYEINNSKWHSVINGSDKERVHIIIDILPEEFCYMVNFS